MANKLVVIALSGLAVSAIALGAAAAISGEGLGAFEVLAMGDRPVCQFDASAKTATRMLAWDGSDHVSVDVAADTKYQRGSGDQVVISGDAAMLPHIRVRDGNIEMDCRRFNQSGPIAITLPGRDFTRFSIAGSGNMTLNGIDQPKLGIHVAGSGNVQASGKTEDLQVHIAGSGKARLAQLLAGDVEIHIAGSGDTEIAPHDDLKVHIAGSGKVRLASEPRHTESHIAGSGEIQHGL